MNTKNLIKKSNKRGATMIEYGLMIAVILVVAVGAFKSMGQNVNTKAGKAANEIGAN